MQVANSSSSDPNGVSSSHGDEYSVATASTVSSASRAVEAELQPVVEERVAVEADSSIRDSISLRIARISAKSNW
jgi:hypothetical protein